MTSRLSERLPSPAASVHTSGPAHKPDPPKQHTCFVSIIQVNDFRAAALFSRGTVAVASPSCWSKSVTSPHTMLRVTGPFWADTHTQAGGHRADTRTHKPLCASHSTKKSGQHFMDSQRPYKCSNTSLIKPLLSCYRTPAQILGCNKTQIGHI